MKPSPSNVSDAIVLLYLHSEILNGNPQSWSERTQLLNYLLSNPMEIYTDEEIRFIKQEIHNLQSQTNIF